MYFKPNLSLHRMFWLVKVSWSHFKRKCLGVSLVVAQANHMSRFAACSSGSLASADAAARRAQTWILLSTA